MPTGSYDAPLLAHVLFMDIVGSTKLATDDQRRIVARLREVVRASEEFKCAQESNQLISVPSGDGMALAFFNRLDAAVLCAVEITRTIQAESLCNIRMGVHTGPVFVEEDIRGQPNLNGAGINLAERVMSAGGAGHILISDTVAQSLRQLGDWRNKIHEIGECQVKDGWVRVWNLVDGAVGNPAMPKKAKALVLRRRSMLAGSIVLSAIAIAAVTWFGARWFESSRRASGLTQYKASIAVLPFVDASPEKDQGPFATGLAADLADDLIKVPGLKVTGAESSAKVAGQSDYREIGHKLNVGTLLQGTVRKIGNQVRITVQLIQATDGTYMWSQKYDREWRDIFAIQADIAHAVTTALQVALLPQQETSGKKSRNIEAYNAIVSGRYLLDRNNEENLKKALAYFERATKLDPEDATAWQGIAEARGEQVEYGFINGQEGSRLARQAQDHALALDPNLVQAHSNLAWLKMNLDWDWAGADREFQRALELAPAYVQAIKGAAQLAAYRGRLNDAIALHRKAMEIDPLSASEYFHAGLVFYDAGQLSAARKAFDKTLELAPEMDFTHCYICQLDLADSKPQDALDEAEKEKHVMCRIYALALVYRALGRDKDADAQLAEAIGKYPIDMPYQIASIYALRGKKDEALQWLKKAYDAADSGMAAVKIDPLLKNLRKDVRYTDLLKKMNLQD